MSCAGLHSPGVPVPKLACVLSLQLEEVQQHIEVLRDNIELFEGAAGGDPIVPTLYELLQVTKAFGQGTARCGGPRIPDETVTGLGNRYSRRICRGSLRVFCRKRES